jgi:hypothetical protein
MKNRVILSFAAFAAVLFAAAPAHAQQTRNAAVTVNGGNAVGLLLHVTDNVALRPELSFTRNTVEQTTGSTTNDSSSWQLGAGGSALFYMGDDNGLRMYLSPRFILSRAKSSTSSNGAQNAYNTSGSVGAQYGLGERFAIFGELGLNYAWQKTSSTLSTVKSSSFGTRSSVGVAIYF